MHPTRTAAPLALACLAVGCAMGASSRAPYASTSLRAASTPTAATSVTPAGGLVAASGAPVAEPDDDRLTAASVGDVDRRANYLAYLDRHTEMSRALRIDPSRRMRVRVVDGEGEGVRDVALRLSAGDAHVEARTHADGWWDYHPGLNGRALSGVVRVEATDPGGGPSVYVEAAMPAHGDAPDVVVRMHRARRTVARALDLAFALDVTGSMGDELRYVNREVGAIVRRVRAAVPDVSVRVAATFYRDRGDAEVVRVMDFTRDVDGFARGMRDVDAGGGGDYPEDMSAGLQAAFRGLSWSARPGAVRVLVLIADAPPKEYDDAAYSWRDATFDAARLGVRILPVAASGADRSVDYIFRAMGSATSTPYVYLTDESGVGDRHLEADTDRVAVEGFASLLERLVVADLRAQGMHEPGSLGAERSVEAVAAR